MVIDFWFEFASTYSYPAAMRIESLAQERGVAVRWRPFLLGPIFQAQGWQDSPFNLYPSKGRYMWRDLERICAAQGIAFSQPTDFPRNGLLAARVACCFATEPWIPAFVRACYQANFGKDLNIATPETLAQCLALSRDGPAHEQLGLIEQAQTQEAKDRLREQTEYASALGLFGAPSFVVGTELFWGNDRLEDALDWARKHSA